MLMAVHLPSFDNEQSAMDWLHGQGYEVVRVVLTRGVDGMVRGSALVRPRATRE